MSSSRDDWTSPTSAVKPGKGRARLPHNLIERRYRNHLNRQIVALRLAVPVLKDDQLAAADVGDGIPLRPPSKAGIIAASMTYIKELEVKTAGLIEYTKKLQEQIEGLQQLVKSCACSILRHLSSLQLGGSLE